MMSYVTYAVVLCFIAAFISSVSTAKGVVKFCPFTVEYEDNKDGTMDFTISGPVPRGSYIAVGFSNDKEMGDDSLIACIDFKDVIYAKILYTEGRSPPVQVPGSDDAVKLVASSYVNGKLTCTIRRDVKSPISRIFDLNNDYHILLAHGISRSIDNVKKHKTEPKVTQDKVDLQVVTETSGEAGNLDKRKAHACLMLVAWVLCSSLGVVLARHYKQMWPGIKILNTPIWFQAHRFLMLLAAVCTIIGFIIIFVHVGGYSLVGQSEGEKRVHMAHPILGIIVMVFTLANPTMALFRCHPGTPHRPIFNWAHFGVGSLARAAAVVTLFIGFDLSTWVHRAGIIIMGLYLGYEVCIELAMEVIACTTKNTPPQDRELVFFDGIDEYVERGATADGEQLRSLLSGDTVTEDIELKPENATHTALQDLPPPKYKLRTVLYIIHAVIVTGFTVALIVVVAIAKTTSACDDDS